MFMLVQHALDMDRGCCIYLLLSVQDDLSAWRNLVADLEACLTHIRELNPPLPPHGMGRLMHQGPPWTASVDPQLYSGLCGAPTFLPRLRDA